MKQIRLFAIVNPILLIIHISASYFAQSSLVPNKNIRLISEKYPTYFTPASLTFIIWDVIYIALFSFVIFHFIKAFRSDVHDHANEELKTISWNFAITNLAAIIWLFTWTNEKLLWSLCLMIVELVTLIITHNRLRIHNAHASFSNKLFTQFPLSIYLGWICVSTILNASVYLKSIGWNGWGISGINWAITLIGILVMLAVGIINRKRDVFFGLVIIWALYGIMTRGRHVGSVEYEPIIIVASVGMGIVGLACMFGLIRNLQLHHADEDKQKSEYGIRKSEVGKQ